MLKLSFLAILLFTSNVMLQEVADAVAPAAVAANAESENAVDNVSTNVEASGNEVTEGNQNQENDNSEDVSENEEPLSLNDQISSTISQIQDSLEGNENGLQLSEDNINTLVNDLWPGVLNFIDQSLSQVSSLNSVAIDEITEEEATLIRGIILLLISLILRYCK